MKWILFALMLGASLVLLRFLLAKLSRLDDPRGRRSAVTVYLIGIPAGLLSAMLPVGLAGTPDWTLAIALVLTMGLVIWEVVRIGVQRRARRGSDGLQDRW